MTRPIYIERLRRMVTPPQYALLERLRNLYDSGQLDVDDAGLLRSPELRSASDLVAIQDFLEGNRSQEYRYGRCNWVDDVVDPPVDASIEEAKVWLNRFVKTINEQLRLMKMFED